MLSVSQANTSALAMHAPTWQFMGTLHYTDFAPGGSNSTINFVAISNNQMIQYVKVIPRITFSGGGVTSAKITILRPVGSALGIANQDVFTGAVINISHLMAGSCVTPAGTTRALLVVDGGHTIGNLTQGEADVYFYTAVLP